MFSILTIIILVIVVVVVGSGGSICASVFNLEKLHYAETIMIKYHDGFKWI